MKKNAIFYVILLLVVMSTNTFSQPDVIPASPTVAELGKYGSWPVDHYHGLPNISIPLYNVEVGQISLPISLSYHASGIKVDQEASWVGLGWSLNAGGVITREIRGISDFRQNSYTSKTFDQLENEDYPTHDEVKCLSYTEPSCDGEPDIFSYNFAGYSGQFIIDKNNGDKIVPLGNNDGLKFKDIVHEGEDDATTSQLKIVDKYGITYVFSELEISEPEQCQYYYVDATGKLLFNNVVDGREEISGWFLTSIEAPNNIDKIILHYKDDVTVQVGSLSATKYYYAFGDEWVYNPLLLNEDAGPNVYNEGLFSISCNTNRGKKLDYISTSNGISIQFNTDFERKDLFLHPGLSLNDKLSPRKALSSISISYNGNPIKNYHFEYDYFNSSITTENIKSLDDDNHFFNTELFETLDVTPFNYRLKLKKLITTNGADTKSLQPYIFSYYGDGDNEPKMPCKNAYGGKDCHGYYNNSITVAEASEFENLFPNITSMFSSTLSGSISEGADNEDCGEESSYGNSLCHFFSYPLTSSGYGSHDLGSDIVPDLNYCRTYSLKEIKYPTGGSSIFEYDVNGITYCPNDLFSETPYGIDNYGGGMRIMNIKDADNEGNIITREYTYSNPLTSKFQQWATPHVYIRYNILQPGITHSTLALNTKPVVASDPVFYASVTESNLPGKIEYNFYTPYDYPLSYESMYMGIYASTGTCAVTFTPYKFNKPFYPYWNDIVGKNFYWGKLKSKKTYKEENTDPVKEEIMEYDFIDGDPIYATKATDAILCSDEVSHANLRVYVYKIFTGEGFLNKKTTTNYYDDGTQETTVENYNYDRENDLLVEQSVEDSKNNIIKTTYKYPPHYELLDITAGNTEMEAIEQMKVDNIINTPIEIVNYKNDKVIAAKLNTFQIYNGIVVPYNSYELETSLPLAIGSGDDQFSESKDEWINFDYDNHYSNKYEFKNFDNKGNLLELLDNRNGMVTSYIWGYDNTLPIANIVNATSNEVYFNNFEEDGNFVEEDDKYSTDFHSGNYCSRLENNDYAAVFDFTKANLESGKYVFSAWVKTSGTASMIVKDYDDQNPYITKNVTNTNGDWKYHELMVDIGSTNFDGTTTVRCEILNNGSADVLIDDARFYPVDAQMTSYTYEPLIGMKSSTDAKNYTTYYEYDDFGRLINIKDKDGNIVENYKYNYGSPVTPTDLLFTQSGGTQNLTVNTDASWTITDLPDFISSVNPSSGTGETTVAVTCSENSGTEGRTGNMLFTYGDKSRAIGVSQEASLESPSVTITSPTEGSYASIGDAGYLTINWNTNYEGNITIEIINNSVWYMFIQTFDNSVGNNSFDWYFVDDQGINFEPGECVIMIYGDDSSVNDQVSFTLVE